MHLKFDFLAPIMNLDREILEKEKIIGSIKNEPNDVIMNKEYIHTKLKGTK